MGDRDRVLQVAVGNLKARKSQTGNIQSVRKPVVVAGCPAVYRKFGQRPADGRTRRVAHYNPLCHFGGSVAARIHERIGAPIAPFAADAIVRSVTICN